VYPTVKTMHVRNSVPNISCYDVIFVTLEASFES